jgi:hypothetical protein
MTEKHGKKGEKRTRAMRLEVVDIVGLEASVPQRPANDFLLSWAVRGSDGH